MKNLKLILIILVIFLLVPSVNAKNIDTDKIDFNKVKFTETQNHVTYKYILDYANMLYEKINADIPFKESWGLEYRYKLHTNGTISENKLFEEFIVNTTPPPFPENMEIGDVYIELYVDTYVVDKITIYYLRENEGALYPGNRISIHIPVKNYQKIFKFYR